MTTQDKKIAITPKPKLPSSSSSNISQNRFVPLSSYSSPYNQTPRPTYSALAHIPRMPLNTTPYNKSPSTASSSTNITRNPPEKEFYDNPNRQIIKILEPLKEKKLDQGFGTLTDYLYPRNTHFYTNDWQNQEYYETILQETRSIVVYHTYSKENPNKIEYSKVKIFKVISLKEWGSKPHINKVLAGCSNYPAYNYYDYQEACIPEIFPPRILEGYNKYRAIFAQENAPPFEYTLQFSIIFRISWILSFNYKKQEAKDTSPPLLLRQYSVKWWKQIDERQADIQAVIDDHNSLIERSPRTSKAKTEIIDLETIERIQAAGSSKEEIQKILNEVKRSPSPSEDILQNSQDPYDDIEEFLNF
nr:reverse transcriptase domain, zinc finger, CCHC-type, aspartic peptidase domain protein [Tanacetum cinerariifolium]